MALKIGDIAPDFKLFSKNTTGEPKEFSLSDYKGKKVVIACPKLDDGQDIYFDKIQKLVDVATINTITVIIMEVPCCGGLLQLVKSAVSQTNRKVPVKKILYLNCLL